MFLWIIIMILKMNAKSRRLDFEKRFMNFHTYSWNNQMRRAWGSRCVYFRWNTFNHQKLKEHKIIMANAWKVLSRRRKYLAQTWHCHSSFGQTSRLPKVISCLLHLSCSWHQTTNLAFPNYFHEFFSVWENKHFIGPKLRKIHGKQNWLLLKKWFDVTNKTIY